MYIAGNGVPCHVCVLAFYVCTPVHIQIHESRFCRVRELRGSQLSVPYLGGPPKVRYGAPAAPAFTRPSSHVWWEGVWHKALVSDCLPLAAPIGLSPLLILTLCGPERVGGANRSQSALHMHVLVCICSNVQQFRMITGMIHEWVGGGGGLRS